MSVDPRELLSRLAAIMRRRHHDTDFDEELATHVALLTERNEARGMPRDEARRQAILQMGGLNPARTVHREARGLPRLERLIESMQAIGRDLRHAARSLARARAFAIVCLLSLGVGMGAFVALVTFFRAIRSPARAIDTHGLVELLVTPLGPLRAKTGVDMLEEWSYPDYEALRQTDTGMTIAGWARGVSEVGTPLESDDTRTRARIPTFFVSSTYFDTFGVSLARGPGFTAADDRPGAPPRVIVSDGYWRRRLASSPDSVGTTLTLDGVPYTIVGIAPPDFRGHFSALFEDSSSSVLFVPLARHPRLLAASDLVSNRRIAWVHIHGRLTPGVDMARARTLVSATVSDIAARFPETNEFKAATVEPYYSLGAAGRRQSYRAAAFLIGMAGLVLLIVCVNLSGMMLVRGAARERELSIREAVGASRSRLIQYLFFEAVWLAVMGGALSVLVLFGLPAAIARSLGTTVPPELDLDMAAIGITVGLCGVVSLVIGLLPALRLSRPNLIPALKDDVSGGGYRVSRVHKWAAAFQVAVAVPFLVLSGVMLDRVRTSDFGFDAHGLVAARLDPAAAVEGSNGISLQGIRATIEETGGVTAVTVGDGMPIDFEHRPVRVSRPDGAQFVTAQVTHVADRYLDALGVRLIKGRGIIAADRSAAAQVAVVSAPLAARLFPDGDALGSRLTLAHEEDEDEVATIVGVTADFATSQLTTERPQVLLPLAERPEGPVYVIARGSAADETRLASMFENLARDLDIELLRGWEGIFGDVATGSELVQKSLQDLVFESVATAVAGGIILMLASLGVLGVVAFMVATRTRELAVRMALGATRWRVVGLMLVDVVKLVTPGVVIGLLIGAILIRRLSSFMGTPLTVGPTPLGAVEPLIYTAAAAVAVLVSLAAGLPAARRAVSIQPMTAMRSE